MFSVVEVCELLLDTHCCVSDETELLLPRGPEKISNSPFQNPRSQPQPQKEGREHEDAPLGNVSGGTGLILDPTAQPLSADLRDHKGAVLRYAHFLPWWLRW